MTCKIIGATTGSSTFGALRQLHTFTRLCVLGSVVRMRWTFALGAHIEAGWLTVIDRLSLLTATCGPDGGTTRGEPRSELATMHGPA
jgi:hypothetical protein